MKTKFFLAAALAVAMVGCNKTEGPVAGVADGESALLKVNLKTAGVITRADAFVDGSDEENAVSTVDFYFFDADGAAYSVSGTDNFLRVDAAGFTADSKTADNIEEVSDVVLLIKKSKQAPPTQLVAVINAPEAASTKSLAQLEAAVLNTLQNGDDNFIMSNSVYMNGSVKVTATQILPEHIFTTDVQDVEPGQKLELEGVTPVDIYVERLAAKVEVVLAEDNLYDTGETYNGAPIYAKVLGWDVTKNTAESNLLKSVDPSWTNLGFTPWNNPAFFRSYWADTQADAAHNRSFANLMAHTSGFDYYHENTKPAVEEDVNSVVATEGNQNPQLVVAAQLVDANGNALELGEWFGVRYALEDLKTTMMNTVASKLYVKADETSYVSVSKDDVVFYQVAETTPEKRYEVKVMAAEGVKYYNAALEELSADAVNAILGDLAPAYMWKTGYAYYYTPIKHYGDALGMVRNHWYKVTLSAITGLGTPVYNPDLIIVPERPVEQDKLNLSAQISILSWSLVNQEVTLQ